MNTSLVSGLRAIYSRCVKRLRPLRARRGVEVIEFAFIFPISVIMMFAIAEYSWYMFQRTGTVDAARVACRAAAQLDPRMDDIAGTATARVQEELERAGVECAAGCNITITDLQGDDPPRVVCEVSVAFRPLTGMLGQQGGDGGALEGARIGAWEWEGVGVLPARLRGTSVAVYEGIP